VRELNNEKVDIIRWSADPKEFVLEALKPAKVKKVTPDQNKRVIHIKVDDDQLSLAIGKRGQNARLTSKLVGWDINIEKDETTEQVFNARVNQATSQLVQVLKIDETTAAALVARGMGSLDAFEGVEAQDIVDNCEGISLEKANEVIEAVLKATQSASSATNPI